MFISQKNDIISLQTPGTGKDCSDKVTVVLCCSMSVLSREHALNAWYWRSANCHPLGIDALQRHPHNWSRIKNAHMVPALSCREVR